MTSTQPAARFVVVRVTPGRSQGKATGRWVESVSWADDGRPRSARFATTPDRAFRLTEAMAERVAVAFPNAWVCEVDREGNPAGSPFTPVNERVAATRSEAHRLAHALFSKVAAEIRDEAITLRKW